MAVRGAYALLALFSILFATAGSFKVPPALGGERIFRPAALSLAGDGQAAVKHPARPLAQLKVVSAIASVFFFLQPSLQAKQLVMPSLSLTRLAGEMLRQSVIAQLLESAAQRDRLGGNTFKILGLSTLIAAFSRSVFLLSQGSLSTPNMAVSAVVSVFALVASLEVVRKNGLPRFDFEIKGPLSSAFLVFHSISQSHS